MRKLVCTNANGTSTTLGDGSIYSITLLEGTGAPDITIQEQFAPYQDGSTPIDQLLEPRDITVNCLIDVGGAPADIYPHRKILSGAFNAKYGPMDIVYTNDAGSWFIQGTPRGPIFPNKNVNDGPQYFQITFHCADPYWQDVSDTVVNIDTDTAAATINITGDVPSPILVSMNGIVDSPVIREAIQDKSVEVDLLTDKNIDINSAFGKKYVRGDNGNTWVVTAPSFKRVAKNDFMLCAISGIADSCIYTSVDGARWIARDLGQSVTLNDITYCNTRTARQWVAVGNGGKIFISTNGYEWSEQSSGVSANLLSVISDKYNEVVCVGATGTIITRLGTGTSWTARTSGTSNDLNSVITTDDAVFIVVGNGGVIATANDYDLATWTIQTSGTTDNLTSVAGFFVSLGVYQVIAIGPTVTKTSTNLTTWTNGGHVGTGIVYDNATWIVVSGTSLFSSTGGSSWTTRTVGATENILSAVYFGIISSWVVVGGAVFSSANLSTWTALTNELPVITNIVYGNGVFIAIAGDMYRSTDGVVWSKVSGVSNVKAVDYSDRLKLWVAVRGGSGITGAYASSDDGATWSSKANTFNASSVKYIDSLRVFMLGGFHCIATSSDGNFVSDGLTYSQDFTRIAYSTVLNKIFLTIYPSGNVYEYTSVGATLKDPSTISGIIYSEVLSLWIIAGNSGLIKTSVDGNTWVTRTSGTTEKILSIAENVDERLIVAVTETGKAISTTDGITWTPYYSGAGENTIIYCRDDKKWYSGGSKIASINTGYDNIIQYMTPDSKFFSLAVGKNVLSLRSAKGSAKASVTYRNRYIGV